MPLKSDLLNAGVTLDYVNTLEANGVTDAEELKLVVEEDVLPSGKSMDLARCKRFCKDNLNTSDSFQPPRNHTNTQKPAIRPTKPRKKAQPPEVKAAGLIPVRKTARGYDVLLAEEHRFGEGRRLNPLGGKVDNFEAPYDTAIREFLEETSVIHLPNGRLLRKELSKLSPLNYYVPGGKYQVYIVFVNNLSLEACRIILKLPSTFTWNIEVSALRWVPLNLLLSGHSDAKFSEFLLKVSECITDLPDRLNAMIPDLEVPDDSTSSMNKSGVVETLDSFIESKRQLIGSLSSTATFTNFFFPRNWKLRVHAPTIPKPKLLSPISTVPKNSASYTQLASVLPDPSALVSVRKVNVHAKSSAFDAESSRNQPNTSLNVYHGTPESWRATAIALNGFNLSLKLHGRALGDGVYSSTNISTAHGYSGSQGSILSCKAFVTQNNKNLTPQSNGEVYVFTQPNHILPEVLFDFAPDNTSVPQYQEEADQAALDTQREHDELKEFMKKSEKEFEHEMMVRYKDIVVGFDQRLSELESLGKSFPHTEKLVLQLCQNEYRLS
ncbi:hypothetical protein GEMRC1_007788 [Eukaryota sp. GEM-RC1]